AMSFAGAYGAADDSKAQDVLKKALDEGCTFWDTAVVYGFGSNEQLIGDFFRANPGSREKVFIASKCGRQLDFENKIRIKVDNSPAHIAEYIEGTISRLGSPPDLYYLHRIEPGFPLELSIAALAKLKEEGKTRYIGLSECSAETLRKACAIAHIDALQIEYSPWSIEHEENGLIDTARELGVAVVAFGPLGSGILTGKYRSAEDFAETDFRRFIPRFSPENFPKNLKIVDAFIALAAKKGCTPGQLSIAWVIAQGFIPIPGTKDEGRLLENWGAGGVELTEDELREIRRLVIEARPVGDRFPPAVRAEAGH
ncbi:aldo-keto reductase, partial [Pseudohyphozyma bogoriensis]